MEIYLRSYELHMNLHRKSPPIRFVICDFKLATVQLVLGLLEWFCSFSECLKSAILQLYVLLG
jgi:hypothetical protein